MAAIGGCMGGGYALDVALQEAWLSADVIHYGHLLTDRESLKKIQAAILGNFGAQDHGISADDVQKFRQTLQRDGKNVDIKIYPDAGHGFENSNNKGGYRSEDASDAWTRTVNFLATTLKK
jgi:carboxymethylenebutenolidase